MEAPLQQVFSAIDEANGGDPTVATWEQAPIPAEVLYGRRMSHHLNRVTLDPGAALQVAARGAHFKRWEIPRSSYPEGRVGYLTWRKELGKYHAREIGALLSGLGYPSSFCERVGSLIRKECLTTDPEAQALEDAACLTFLELEYGPFLNRHGDPKIIEILRKTWGKMSPKGQAVALDLAESLHGRAKDLLRQALGNG